MIFIWQLRRLLEQLRFWEVVFSPVGIGWTLSEIAIAVGYQDFMNRLLPYLWLLLVVGLILAVLICWPKRAISKMLPNIDTEVEVRVGDIFSSNHPIVVTVPTTLEADFDNRSIDRSSIQGQYIEKYSVDCETFKKAIMDASKHVLPVDEVDNFYSNGSKVKRYLPGEFFPLRQFKRVAYTVTFASFNEHGTAQIKSSEFFDFLPRLWLGIRERGDIGNVDVPLMGSRFGRTGIENRKEILRELLQSFSVASSEARLVDKVTFYIRPSDFTRWGFSFDYIERILANICDDHQRKPNSNTGVGKSA